MLHCTFISTHNPWHRATALENRRFDMEGETAAVKSFRPFSEFATRYNQQEISIILQSEINGVLYFTK
jgi:hypothetical protein